MDEGDQRSVKTGPERSVGSCLVLRVCKVSVDRMCMDVEVSVAMQRPSGLAPRCGEARDEISHCLTVGINLKLHRRQKPREGVAHI